MKSNRIGAIVIIAFLVGLFVLSGIMSKPDTADATVIMIANHRNYTGLSTDTKPTLTTAEAGAIFIETDTGLQYLWNGSEWGIQTVYQTGDTTSFTAPGTSAAVFCRGYSLGGYQFTFSGMNTSATMILQGRSGDAAWAAVDEDSVVYAANGNEGLLSSNIAAFDSMRLKFHSEAGGTDVFVNYNSTLGMVSK